MEFIFIMLGICFLAILLMLLSGPLKLIAGIFKNAAIGFCLIIALNFVLKPLGFNLGLNLLTLGLSGVLGLPGVCAMYVISAVL